MTLLNSVSGFQQFELLLHVTYYVVRLPVVFSLPVCYWCAIEIRAYHAKKMRFTLLVGIPNEKFELSMLTNSSINKEKCWKLVWF